MLVVPCCPGSRSPRPVRHLWAVLRLHGMDTAYHEQMTPVSGRARFLRSRKIPMAHPVKQSPSGENSRSSFRRGAIPAPTDTHGTTCLHVPSIGLVVAGDPAYNDVHVHLGESTGDSRKEWIAALDTIESLKPRAVAAGHKRPGRPDEPNTIVEQNNTFVTSTGSQQLRGPRRNCTTRCSRSIPIA